VVHYPWHPLHGQELAVVDTHARSDGQCFQLQLRPGLTRFGVAGSGVKLDGDAHARGLAVRVLHLTDLTAFMPRVA
jgi:hypothetical protein